MDLRNLDYWCWLVIHILPSIGSSFKSKPKWICLFHVKSTNSTMLYSASTISSPANYTLSSIGISTHSRFKEEMRVSNSFVASYTLHFSCSSSMEKSTLYSASKILDILQLFFMIWGIQLRPHLRPSHNSIPYIKHYFPQVMVSSRIIKLRDKVFQNLIHFTKLWMKQLTSWSNGCTILATLGGKKTIGIMLNYKVEKTKWLTPKWHRIFLEEESYNMYSFFFISSGRSMAIDVNLVV